MPAQITVLNPSGINRDIDSYELPETQWSDGNNIQFDNDMSIKTKMFVTFDLIPNCQSYAQDNVSCCIPTT